MKIEFKFTPKPHEVETNKWYFVEKKRTGEVWAVYITGWDNVDVLYFKDEWGMSPVTHSRLEYLKNEYTIISEINRVTFEV